MNQDIQQSSQDDMPSVLRDFLAAWQRDELDDMLPARVVSYNELTNRAILKPLVQMGTADGRKISRPNEVNVPVFRFGGGGFFIRMPIKAGDFGWLKANDRDISLVLQRQGQEDWPNTVRTHDFNDSMFFPDTLKGWVIDSANIDSLVIQSMDGSVCIALASNQLKIKAPTAVFNIPNTTWTGNINIVGNIVSTGGNASFGGGTLIHNGKNVGATHTHGSVQPGSGTSGVPT